MWYLYEELYYWSIFSWLVILYVVRFWNRVDYKYRFDLFIRMLLGGFLFKLIKRIRMFWFVWEFVSCLFNFFSLIY